MYLYMQAMTFNEYKKFVFKYCIYVPSINSNRLR